MSVRWQHFIDHADTKQKPANVTRLSSRRSSAADRQSVKRDYKWTLTDVVDGAVTELQVDTYWCGRWGCHRATSGHLLMWSMGLSQSYKWTLTDVVDGAVTELQVDTYWCGRWGCHRTTSGHLLMWSMGLSQTYKWTLTDVVDGTGTELAKELLCPESLQVVDEVGPQVQHIVA